MIKNIVILICINILTSMLQYINQYNNFTFYLLRKIVIDTKHYYEFERIIPLLGIYFRILIYSNKYLRQR
jgi:hypothetical protein